MKIRPIAGLVHHGSGPMYTNLCDPEFPQKLAEYARAVAERYPWLDDYTPINEPLTTARFSGLYGHWYPHGRDDRTFVTALLHECRGVALAMKAIREVNPRAKLIQTEESGRILSTPALSYQADFENERRWLTFDLLCGRVDHDHPLWGYLLGAGAPQAMLETFLEQPCPPDIIGLNYYVTSERFLDERIEHYPPELHGGNGRHEYADAAAIRVAHDECHGLRGVLNEAWRRYRLPLAVTEAHLGCTPDEQVRWRADMWDETLAAKADGVDIRAFTVWALLGAYDWHCLVTQDLGCYESGVFSMRDGEPCPTELVEVVRSLAGGRRPDHLELAEPGWWQREDRLLYPPPDGDR